MRHAVARLLAAGIVALAMMGVPAGMAQAEDYYDGLRAYDSGDFAEAARIWRRSAESGDAKAQLRLGKLYENGEGVERDYVEALRWYILAERNGSQDAAVAAYFLRRNLTEAQQRQATGRADAWRPDSEESADAERQSADSRALEERRRAAQRERAERERAEREARERAEQEREARERAERERAERERAERRQPWRRDAKPGTGPHDGDEADPGWLAQAVAGSELRRTLRLEDMTRYDIWRFEPGGTVRGNYSATMNRSGAVYEEDSDRGRWRIRSGDLCITWQSWADGLEHCYEVTLLENGHWRMRHEVGASEDRIVRR